MPASALLTYAIVGVVAPPSPATVPITYDNVGGTARVEMTGPATQTIDLSMMAGGAGLKLLLVTVDTTDAGGLAVVAPVSIHWTSNALAKVEELSPDGVFLLASPNPTHGVTALSIVTTANAVVHVLCLG
jgi:hypothetical protein